MIEKTILKYLQANTDVPCYMEVPATMPDEFIVLDLIAMGSNNYVRNAEIAFMCYAATKLRAAEINEAVIEIMGKASELTDVFGAHLTTAGDRTATETKKYRYRAVFLFKRRRHIL